MFFVYVLLAVLLCYGTVDLLLRTVYAVLLFGVKTKRCHVFFVKEPKDAENVVLSATFQRFFLPKDSFWIVVDGGLGENEQIAYKRRFEEKSMLFFSQEEFIKLIENGLQPDEKLL